MSDDECLHAPAPIVAECEPVEMTPDPLEGDVPTVDAVFLLAVDRVVGHLRVEPSDDVSNGLEI